MERADLLPGTLDFLILKTVSLGPLHGYGILLRIEQITAGGLSLEQGARAFIRSRRLVASGCAKKPPAGIA
jgi:PadR family transcriptional regulator